MNIAVIGTGNVGGALATKWSEAGHNIFLGVRDLDAFKEDYLLRNRNTAVLSISKAVKNSEIILLATPAPAAVAVTASLGSTYGKVIIDAMNSVMGNGPKGYTNTSDAILGNTETKDVVKCFNTTGFNNMENPKYGDISIDTFVAGDSELGKKIAKQLSKDIGFAECYDIGGNEKFELMEQYAWFWINLAMFQGQGREIGFKLLKR